MTSLSGAVIAVWAFKWLFPRVRANVPDDVSPIEGNVSAMAAAEAVDVSEHDRLGALISDGFHRAVRWATHPSLWAPPLWLFAVRFNVLAQVPLVGATKVTQRALVRPLARMRPHMLQQVATLGTPVSALVTEESAVFLVKLSVLDKFVVGQSRETTFLALELEAQPFGVVGWGGYACPGGHRAGKLTLGRVGGAVPTVHTGHHRRPRRDRDALKESRHRTRHSICRVPSSLASLHGSTRPGYRLWRVHARGARQEGRGGESYVGGCSVRQTRHVPQQPQPALGDAALCRV